VTPDLDASASGRWQPPIREIAVDHEALGRVTFEPGDEMELTLCDATGLFFLDVETGSVEGWTWDPLPLPSPGNRYVYLPSDETPVLYDRLTGRAFTWDAAELSLVRASADGQPWDDAYTRSLTNSLVGWAAGEDEWLIVRRDHRYAVIDHSMEAVAWFEVGGALPVRWWPHPDGTHLLARLPNEDRSGLLLYVINLVDGVHESTGMPASHTLSRTSDVHVSRSGITVVSGSYDDDACSIVRYDWSLELLSEVSLPCSWPTLDVSPDGRLVSTVTLSFGQPIFEPGIFQRLSVTSVFDATTGEELIRVKGAQPSDALFGVHDGRTRWLADSSGLVLDTRDDTRTISGGGITVFPPDTHWWRGLLIPSRDDPNRLDRPFELYLRYCDSVDGGIRAERQCRVLSARVVDGSGDELASMQLTLRIVSGSRWDVPLGSIAAVAYNRTSWGVTSDVLRVHLTLGGPYESAGYRPSLPPVMDGPPFAELGALEVVEGEACQNLREAPERESPSIACLPGGIVVGAVEPTDYTHYARFHVVGPWAHVRTEGGDEGWMHLAGLRWAQ